MSLTHQLPRQRPTILIGLALILSAGLPGCSNIQSVHQQDQVKRYTTGITSLDAIPQLEMIAEREALNPSTPRKDLADQILDWQTKKLAPASSEYTKAHRSLDDTLNEALANFQTPELEHPPIVRSVATGYTRARAAMLDENYEVAIVFFEQMHELSPTSRDILLGLADASMKSGDRPKAAAAYLKAIDLGDRTTRALVYASMGSAKDADRVIELCGHVWQQEYPTDRGGRLLAGMMLGKALVETGSYAAGAQVLTEALAGFDTSAVREPRFRRELIQLYTNRAEQYAYLGDAWMVLDRPRQAMMSYERAGSLVNAEPHVLTARKVATHLAAGHSAMGAITLLEAIDAAPGNDSPTLHTIARALSDHQLVAPLIVESLTAQANDRSLPLSSRQTIIGIVLSMTESVQAQASILASIDPLVVSPIGTARVLGAIDNLPDQVDMVLMMIEQSPSVGPVVTPSILRLSGQATEILKLADANTPAAQLLRALIAAELQRPDLIATQLDDLQSIDFATQSTTWLIAHTRAAVLSNHWNLAESLLNQCAARQAAMNDQEQAFYADTLVLANQTDQALAFTQERASSPQATPPELLLRARLASMLGDSQTALQTLERAIQLDPYDESIYEKLIALRGPNGALADDQQLQILTQALNQHLPQSALIRLILAYKLTNANPDSADQFGQLLQSEKVLVQAHQDYPYRQIGIDLLLGLWRSMAAAGDPNAIIRGISWTQTQLNQMPGSVDLASAHARLLVFNEQEAAAEEFLADFYQRIPSRQAGQLHEGLVRSDPQRRADADALALKRLNGLVSITDCLERLDRAAASSRLTEFAPELLIPLHPSQILREAQLARIIRALSVVVQTTTDKPTNDYVIELLNRIRNANHTQTEQALFDTFNQIELVARVSSSSFDLNTYEQFLRQSIASRTVTAKQLDLTTIAVQALIRIQSVSQATELFAKMCINADATLDTSSVTNLITTVAQIGAIEDIVGAVNILENANHLEQTSTTLIDALGTRPRSGEPQTPIQAKADILYTAAVVASFYERDDLATELYRTVLKIDPTHTWASNDLGYRLTELGQDLVEAERLLVQAHTAEPEAASITDSLAWARYMTGIMADQLDDQGQVTKPGAKTLLKLALTLQDGSDNPEIHHHLADTLWMLKEFDAAIESWSTAETLLLNRLTELTNPDNGNQANPTVLESINKDIALIRFKIEDAKAGKAPKVTPTATSLPVPVRTPDPQDPPSE